MGYYVVEVWVGNRILVQVQRSAAPARCASPGVSNLTDKEVELG